MGVFGTKENVSKVFNFWLKCWQGEDGVSNFLPNKLGTKMSLIDYKNVTI